MKILYKKLTSSKIFKDWKEKHKESFLCSFIEINNVQFDFYNENETITTFTMGDNIEIKENEKIFKKTKLNELKLDEIKLTKEQALKIIKEKYPKETFTKEIFILQNPKEPIWNITLITSSLKILNIRIDMNKKITSETFEPLTNLMRQVK